MAGNYLKTMQLTKELQKQAVEASKNRELAEKEIEEAKGSIEKAKKIDSKVSKAEKNLAEAENAYEEKEYKDSLGMAQAAKKEAEKAYQKRLNSMLDSVENLNVMIEDLGGEPSGSMNMVNSARDALSEGDLEKAHEMASKAWEEAEKTIHENLSKAFSSAQFLIMLAKENEEDTSIPEDFLKRARDHLEENSLEEAMESIDECMDSIKTRLEDHINDKLEDTHSNIKVANDLGLDPGKAEEVVGKARDALEEQDFEEALSLSKQSLNEVNNAISKNISEIVKNAKERLQEAQKMDAETERAEAYIEEARNAVKEKAYQQVIDFTNKAIEELDNAQFQQVLKVISSSRSKFIAAKKAGADITTALELLNKARDALKSSDFVQAIEYAKKGDQSIEDIVESYQNVEEAVIELDENIQEATTYNIRVDEAKVHLERSTIEAESHNFDKAIELVKRGNNVLKKEWMNAINKNASAVEDVLITAQEIGANVDEPMEKLTEIIKRGKEGDYSEALGESNALLARSNGILADALDEGIDYLEDSMGKRASEDVIAGLAQVKSEKDQNALEAAKDFIDLRKRALSSLKKHSIELIEDLEKTAKLLKKVGHEKSDFDERINAIKEKFEEDDYQKVLKEGAVLSKEGDIAIFKQIDKRFSEAKKSVVEVKKTGADIKDLKDTLIEVPPLVKSRSYGNALEIIQDVMETAKERKGARDKAYDAISQAAASIVEAKKVKADIKSATDFLIRSKKSFEAGEFEKALNLAESTTKSAKQAKNEKETDLLINELSDNIDTLSESGKDTESFSSSLEKVVELRNKGDLEESLKKGQELEDTLHAALKSEVKEILEKGKKALKEAESIGLDVNELEEVQKEAEEAISSRDYTMAFSKARKALRSINELKNYSKRAGESLQETQELMSDVESIGFDTTDIKENIDRAINALQEGDFEKSYDVSEKQKTLIEKKARETVLTSIENYEHSLRESEKNGVDISQPQSYLDQAKENLENKKFSEANKLAMLAADEMENVILQKDLAENSLDTARKKVESFREEGYNNLPVEEALSKAKDLFESGDYDASIKQSIHVGDLILDSKEKLEKVNEDLKKLEKVINIIEQGGGDTEFIENGKKKVMKLAKSGKTGEAEKHAKELIDEAEALIISTTSVIINNIEAGLQSARSMGADTKEATQSLVKVKKALKNKNVDKLNENLKEARVKTDEAMTKHVLSLLANADVKIIDAKSKNIPVDEVETLRKEATELLDEKDYRSALAKIQDLEEKIEGLSKPDKGVKDAMVKTESTIATAQKFGLKVKDAEKILSQAKKVEASDPVKAKQLAEQANLSAHEVLEKLRPHLEISLAGQREVPSDEEVEVPFKLSNEKKGLAKVVGMQLEGVEGSVEDTSKVLGGKTKTLSVRLAPLSEGEHDVTFRVRYQGILGEAEQEAKVETRLNAVAKKAKTAHLSKAESASKCAVCKGKIKPGLEIITCECGETYHKACGERMGKCAKCGRSLDY